MYHRCSDSTYHISAGTVDARGSRCHRNTRGALPTHAPLHRYLGGGEDHFTQQAGSCPDVGPTVDLWDTAAPSDRNGTYGAYTFTAAAVDAVETAHRVNSPLFLYFAAQNVHAPYQAPARFLALYADCEWCTEEGRT